MPMDNQGFNTQIPMGSFGMAPSENPTVMAMRWRGDVTTMQLFESLAGVSVYLDDKQRVQYIYKYGVNPNTREPNIKPLMNIQGAITFIALLEPLLTPQASLSNISEEAGGELYVQYVESFLYTVNLNQHDFQIDSRDLFAISNIVLPIIFLQINRAVNGHESKNSKTTIAENTGNMTSTNKSGGGWNLNPFK